MGSAFFSIDQVCTILVQDGKEISLFKLNYSTIQIPEEMTKETIIENNVKCNENYLLKGQK